MSTDKYLRTFFRSVLSSSGSSRTGNSNKNILLEDDAADEGTALL